MDIRDFRSAFGYTQVYPFPFGSTATSIAAAATGNTGQRQQRSDCYFIGTHIVGAVFNAAVTGTTIAGTPLSGLCDPSPPAAVGNTANPNTLVLLQFQVNNVLDCDQPYTWYGNVGTGIQPLILACPIILPPNSQSQYQITNNTAVGIAGQVCIKGFQVTIADYMAYMNRAK